MAIALFVVTQMGSVRAGQEGVGKKFFGILGGCAAALGHAGVAGVAACSTLYGLHKFFYGGLDFKAAFKPLALGGCLYYLDHEKINSLVGGVALGMAFLVAGDGWKKRLAVGALVGIGAYEASGWVPYCAVWSRGKDALEKEFKALEEQKKLADILRKQINQLVPKKQVQKVNVENKIMNENLEDENSKIIDNINFLKIEKKKKNEKKIKKKKIEKNENEKEKEKKVNVVEKKEEDAIKACLDKQGVLTAPIVTNRECLKRSWLFNMGVCREEALMYFGGTPLVDALKTIQGRKKAEDKESAKKTAIEILSKFEADIEDYRNKLAGCRALFGWTSEEKREDENEEENN